MSAVRSLHIDHGLPDPLVNCRRLQRLLKGIKQVQGSASPRHLLITVDLLQAIQHCLDLSTSDHLMLWAVCCLGFFGFLRAGEFTVNSVFDPNTQMTVDDLQADSLVHPSCLKVLQETPSTWDVIWGVASVCPITALGSYLLLRGSAPRPLFTFSDGRPLTQQQLSSSLQSILHGAGYSGSYSGHSFRKRSDNCSGPRGSCSPYQNLRALV